MWTGIFYDQLMLKPSIKTIRSRQYLDNQKRVNTK